MPLKLNGDNSVSTPAFTGDDADTGLQCGTNELKLVTGGTEAVTVDSSQNVGIGTTSPSTALHISGTGVNDSRATFTRSGVSGVVGIVSNDLLLAGAGTDDTDGGIQFFTGGSSRGGIKPVGHVTWGSTTTELPGFNGNTSVGLGLEYDKGLFLSRADNACLFLNNNITGDLARFSRSGSQKGKITINTTSVAYNTNSDYRLKQNVVSLSGAITRVKQLLPKRFNFIADPDTTVDGFLAHEAQTVVPEAVTGTQDAVDSEGNPDYQGIDQSKLVPLLTAALQEAIAKIETLETQNADLLTRVTALENAQ